MEAPAVSLRQRDGGHADAVHGADGRRMAPVSCFSLRTVQCSATELETVGTVFRPFERVRVPSALANVAASVAMQDEVKYIKAPCLILRQKQQLQVYAKMECLCKV